ncbi:MAG: hypothetical protein WD896_02645 [Parcubacteria group bacterium]
MTKNIKAAKASFFVIAVLSLSVPAFSHAATYLYVTQSGQLSNIVANSPTDAMRMAPNIGVHSGVMLLSNTSTDVALVGDHVASI